MKIIKLLPLIALVILLTGCAKNTNLENLNSAQKNHLNDLNNQQSGSERNNWPNYINTHYQYTINYPNSWYVDTAYSEDDFTLRGPAEDNTYIGGDTTWSNYQNPSQYNLGNIPDDLVSVYLLIYKSTAETTLDEFITEKNYAYTLKEDIKINNLSGIRLTSGNAGGVGDQLVTHVLIKNEAGVFDFSHSLGSTDNIMNQMLRTLKFN